MRFYFFRKAMETREINATGKTQKNIRNNKMGFIMNSKLLNVGCPSQPTVSTFHLLGEFSLNNLLNSLQYISRFSWIDAQAFHVIKRTHNTVIIDQMIKKVFILLKYTINPFILQEVTNG